MLMQEQHLRERRSLEEIFGECEYSGPVETFNYPDYQYNDSLQFASLVRTPGRERVIIHTSQIQQDWADDLVVSQGFYACLPLIAVSPYGKVQMIHFSSDPWRETLFGSVREKIKAWKAMGCQVMTLRTENTGSAYVGLELLKHLPATSVTMVDMKADSRFDLVIDVPAGKVIVQLSDIGEVRTYLLPTGPATKETL